VGARKGTAGGFDPALTASDPVSGCFGIFPVVRNFCRQDAGVPKQGPVGRTLAFLLRYDAAFRLCATVPMAFIDPKYSIGIVEMDAQHARLIQIMEEFRAIGADSLLEPAGIDAAEQALEQLLKYTTSHFAGEEAFMAKHHYPDIEAHKKQHQELTTVVARLLDEARVRKTSGAALKLNLFATVWLVEHIMQEDNKYARFVLGKPQL
jgi:hemerythrin